MQGTPRAAPLLEGSLEWASKFYVQNVLRAPDAERWAARRKRTYTVFFFFPIVQKIDLWYTGDKLLDIGAGCLSGNRLCQPLFR